MRAWPRIRSSALVGGLALIAVIAAAGCRGGGEARPAPVAGPPDLTAQPAGPDDLVVARVDGRPVYGSCVAAQAAGRHVDRATALADCVDLELLAGAALARGLDRDPAVAAEGRAAAATRLVDVELRARVQRWADLPRDFRDPLLEKNRVRMNRPESRASFYGRIKVAKDDVGGPRDQLAEQASRAAYAQLGPRDDLFKADLDAVVHAAAAAADPTLEVEIGRGAPTEQDFGLREYYRQALFSVDRPGQAAAPVRSPWGWDIILYSDFRRPPALTEDEFTAKLFPAARLEYWNRWSGGLARGHQVSVADPALLDRLWGGAVDPREDRR